MHCVKAIRTTVFDFWAASPLAPVSRQFRAERLNQLSVADFTYVRTWQGVNAEVILTHLDG